MGYSKYKKIRNVVKKFNLELQSVQLFGEIERVEPSNWLQETLRMADVSLLTSEKAKSERLISPILVEVFQAYKLKISFFSGEQLNIRPNDDLAGECDFFFSLHPPKPYIDAPIISLAEAKNEDMNWGIAQCAAQMLGAKIFNEVPLISMGKDMCSSNLGTAFNRSTIYFGDAAKGKCLSQIKLKP